MNLAIFSVVWTSFFVLVFLFVLQETKRNDLHCCISCGRVIDGPGICSSCAAEVESVDRVVEVHHLINPEDLRD